MVGEVVGEGVGEVLGEVGGEGVALRGLGVGWEVVRQVVWDLVGEGVGDLVGEVVGAVDRPTTTFAIRSHIFPYSWAFALTQSFGTLGTVVVTA